VTAVVTYYIVLVGSVKNEHQL